MDNSNMRTTTYDYDDTYINNSLTTISSSRCSQDSNASMLCERCGNPAEASPAYTADGLILCKSCRDKLEAELTEYRSKFVGCKEFEEAGKLILKGLESLGFELDEQNFKDTPKRLARAYREIFDGCVNTQQKIDSILATSFPSDGHGDMVIEKDIVCFSMCPHHLLPVEYHVCVGYIPAEDGRVLGISKLARLVEILAKRPALQETFTHDIVDQLHRIGVQGAIAVVEGRHMCMRMRGAKSANASVTTTALEGVFRYDAAAKKEFFDNIEHRLTF